VDVQQVKLANTELTVSKLIYGTGSLMRVPFRSARFKLLELACELGFTHFDTAPLYGYGNCEKEIGELLQSYPILTVTTKIGLKPPTNVDLSTRSFFTHKAFGKVTRKVMPPIRDFSVEWADLSLKRSLKRLRRDQIDLLLLHEAHLSDVKSNDLITWLEKQKASGTISEFGISGSRDKINTFSELDLPSSFVRQEAADIFSMKNIEVARLAQIRFGYMRQITENQKEIDPLESFSHLIRENREDAVIISTTKQRNLRSIVNLGEPT